MLGDAEAVRSHMSNVCSHRSQAVATHEGLRPLGGSSRRPRRAVRSILAGREEEVCRPNEARPPVFPAAPIMRHVSADSVTLVLPPSQVEMKPIWGTSSVLKAVP